MIKEIKDNIWQLYFVSFGSCVYVIKLKDKNILIDTSSKMNKSELINDLKKLNIIPSEINIILLTHGHFDHIENIELFENAETYGSKEDFRNCEKIKDIKKFVNDSSEFLDDPKFRKSTKKFMDIKKQPIKEVKVIETPGHTHGCVCLLYKDVLFSGDTLFHKSVGRTDFPNSSVKLLENSLEKLEEVNYKILCPGHED
ncbi:MAG: MBL fold metallo-hydrolase [archaeon]|nr:MBL fold metallo-hydrolase [archaeon]